MCKVPEAEAARADPEPERRAGMQKARERAAGDEARRGGQSHNSGPRSECAAHPKQQGSHRRV